MDPMEWLPEILPFGFGWTYSHFLEGFIVHPRGRAEFQPYRLGEWTFWIQSDKNLKKLIMIPWFPEMDKWTSEIRKLPTNQVFFLLLIWGITKGFITYG